ncbi:MAG: hypothetical protein JRD03_05750 [Deltaproteobacteria bacterium]|nr:hypothetical protein [Deltaproteobacteria bacterium]
MSKILFAISLVGLLACGAGDSDTGAIGSGSDTPAVSAAVSASDEVEGVEIIEGDRGNVEAAAAATRSCIGLVASGDFEDALPVCLEAASIDADNGDVQAALAKAQTETAKQAASDAAADAAGDAVGSALGELGN